MSKPPPYPTSSRGAVHPRIQQLGRAAQALQLRHFTEAEQLAAAILKANRVDSDALSILARALLGQNRATEAIAALEKAARRGSNPDNETLLAAMLGPAGRRTEAIELLRQTTARRPPFVPAFRELAGQLATDERLEEAIAVIDRGIELAPENIELQLDLARLCLQQNKRGKARAALLKANEAAPGRPEILRELARVLLLEGEYSAAADHYRQALALRPDDALTRADLATCLLEMGEREAGEASLRSALRGRPEVLGRAIYALVQSSHGRFFFRQSAVSNFLQGKTT